MGAAPATYEDALVNLAARRDDLVVMTAENRAAIRGIAPRLGERFIDVGIAEMTMVGAAAGLALRGRRPVVHALAAFLTLRAFEFIRTDVGIAGLPVKLVGAVPGFLSDANGPTHQAIEDVALMRAIPGMEVYCPSDLGELLEMLPVVVDRPSPAYLRFNGLAPSFEHRAPFAPGVAEALTDGDDVTLLTYGFMARECVAAAELLARRSIGARVVHLRTLAPVDEGAVADALSRAKLVAVVEDHLAVGGLCAIVAEVALRRRVTGRVLPIALEGRWFRPGLLRDVLDHEGFSAERIAARVAAALGASTESEGAR